MTIHLGENLRLLRKEHNLTQEQLAEALGVTPGAVHKWETEKATPELVTLVDLAVYFETSIDALLNYGWEKMTMEKAVKQLKNYTHAQQLADGTRYAEKALLRFPNSFQVVYCSANLYFLTLKKSQMPRAVELYERSLALLDQNEDPEISDLTIQNRIASCYCYLERTEDAVAILKRNNAAGCNNYLIGLLLSQMPGHEDESLPYLSEALGSCYHTLYNTCIGYANAYGVQNKLAEISELITLLYQFGEGLRTDGATNWIDRGNVKLFLILATMDSLRHRQEEAIQWLRKARESARRFDAAPNYHTYVGMKFYHGSQTASSYDDMGSTAMDIITNTLADKTIGKSLRPLWDRLLEEEP